MLPRLATRGRAGGLSKCELFQMSNSTALCGPGAPAPTVTPPPSPLPGTRRPPRRRPRAAPESPRPTHRSKQPSNTHMTNECRALAVLHADVVPLVVKGQRGQAGGAGISLAPALAKEPGPGTPTAACPARPALASLRIVLGIPGAGLRCGVGRGLESRVQRAGHTRRVRTWAPTCTGSTATLAAHSSTLQCVTPTHMVRIMLLQGAGAALQAQVGPGGQGGFQGRHGLEGGGGEGPHAASTMTTLLSQQTGIDVWCPKQAGNDGG